MSQMRYLLLLVLAACASTPEAQYERGTYRPVRPPQFTPAEDAPHTIGQPGHINVPREGYPKSPHTRILPGSSRPGLWSGDSPRATNDQDPKPQVSPEDIFDFLPEEPEPYELLAGFDCLRLIDTAIASRVVTTLGSMQDFKKGYPLHHWRCIIASLYQRCVDLRHGDNEAARSQGSGMPSHARLKERADATKDLECGKGLSKKAESTYSILRRKLENEYRIRGGK